MKSLFGFALIDTKDIEEVLKVLNVENNKDDGFLHQKEDDSFLLCTNCNCTLPLDQLSLMFANCDTGRIERRYFCNTPVCTVRGYNQYKNEVLANANTNRIKVIPT